MKSLKKKKKSSSNPADAGKEKNLCPYFLSFPPLFVQPPWHALLHQTHSYLRGLELDISPWNTLLVLFRSLFRCYFIKRDSIILYPFYSALFFFITNE